MRSPLLTALLLPALAMASVAIVGCHLDSGTLHHRRSRPYAAGPADAVGSVDPFTVERVPDPT